MGYETFHGRLSITPQKYWQASPPASLQGDNISLFLSNKIDHIFIFVSWFKAN
jgi:hypothetical protein